MATGGWSSFSVGDAHMSGITSSTPVYRMYRDWGARYVNIQNDFVFESMYVPPKNQWVGGEKTKKLVEGGLK
jgi:hypothetical protein